MSDRLRMLGVFGAGFALGVILAWTAPPAPSDPGQTAMPTAPPMGGIGAAGGAQGPPPDGSGGLPGGPPPDGDKGPPPEGGALLPAGEAAPLPEGALPPGPDGAPPTVDAAGNPIGPPPPEGAGPPDGAVGPPLTGGSPTPGAPPSGTDWIEVHLGNARAFWTGEAERLSADHPALAERARLLAASVPETDGRAPPLPDVVVLLVREMELMDAMKAAGADTSGVEAELAMLIALR